MRLTITLLLLTSILACTNIQQEVKEEKDTTTPSNYDIPEEGLTVKLPEYTKGVTAEVNVRNVVQILINSDNRILYNRKEITINELKSNLKKFLTNNGKAPNLSDSAQVAVISLKSDKGTSYEFYMQVWNAITDAYTELRDEEAIKKYNQHYDELTSNQQDTINKIYPKLVSEAEPGN